MTLKVWRSYIWTADKEMNMEAIFTVINTISAEVKIRPKKVQAWAVFEFN